MSVFNFYEAFDRNVGWITAQELDILKTKRVAIAGLGGVGGCHLLTLLRLGVSKFNIAEMDVVELANFNRQVCAGVSNIGKRKIDVLERLGKDINPEADFRLFPEGVNDDNLEAFLEDVDLYVDGLDFFVLDIRKKIFKECFEKIIPAMTTAPLGMGVAHLNFMPDGMSFDEYFRLDDAQGDDRFIKFLIGLSPSMLQRGYLVDMSRVDFSQKKGPSTPMSCELCAGVAGTEALKILLGRCDVMRAPYGCHFDAYRHKMKMTWRPWGNRNIFQVILFFLVKRLMIKNEKRHL
jgi:molybdopterin/thiamine biosynthesis adenylyltransferase